MESLLPLAGYLASILMGLSLGLIGGGGSILTVPILVYLFQVPVLEATAYSLFIVGLTALVGGLSSYRRGDVDLRTGLIFAAPSFLGVFVTRSWIVPSLPDPIMALSGFAISKPLFIMVVFAVLMLAASVSMIRSNKTTAPIAALPLTAIKRNILIALEGLVVGSITGLVGAGGGFLIIPALVLLVGLPMRIAVGTSLFIIAIKSLLGFTGDLRNGLAADWQLLFSIVGLAVIGILVGGTFAKRVQEAKLKKAFGYFVLLMGSVILFQQFSKIL